MNPHAAVLSAVLSAASVGGGLAWATQPGGSDRACPPSESTTIVGRSTLSADDLRSWWAETGRGQPPTLQVPIGDLIGYYVAEGEAEGVRGDLAFAQAVHETGYFGNGDTARNNFAGIAHYDHLTYGRAFRSPREGVRAQVQMLRKYAQGNDVDLAQPDVSPDAGASSSTWAGLAGTWATDRAYWTSLSNLFRKMCDAAGGGSAVMQQVGLAKMVDAEGRVAGYEQIGSRQGGTYVEGAPWRIIIHETQGDRLSASYAASHPTPPHLWYDPATRQRLQSVPLTRSAYALYQPRGVGYSANGDRSLQVELVGWSSDTPDETDEQLRNIAQDVIVPFVVFARSQGGDVDLGQVVDPPPVPSSAASPSSPYRASPAEWASFNGIAGHNWVPGNDHWDPGAMDLRKIAAYALAMLRQGGTVQPVSASKEPPAAPKVPTVGAAADRLLVDALGGWEQVGRIVAGDDTPILGRLYDQADGIVDRYTTPR